METASTENIPVLAMSFPQTGAHSSPHTLSAPTITTKTPTLASTGPSTQIQQPQPQPQLQQAPQAPQAPSLAKEISDTEVSEVSNSSLDFSQDSNTSHHSESMSTEHRRDLRQFQRHQSKERTIEQVLEKGKILKVSYE